jgi:N-terminal domain of reverse transcriptase
MSRMKERKTPSMQETDEMSVAWSKLPWRKLEQHCFRIQKRIYRAKQNGNTRKVEKLQKLLMKSEAARLLAVRRVTQENQGKKTAGIDGVKSVSPKERFVLAQQIHPKNWKHSKRPLPVRRIWIVRRVGAESNTCHRQERSRVKTSRTRANPEGKPKGDCSMLIKREISEGMYDRVSPVLCA